MLGQLRLSHHVTCDEERTADAVPSEMVAWNYFAEGGSVRRDSQGEEITAVTRLSTTCVCPEASGDKDWAAHGMRGDPTQEDCASHETFRDWAEERRQGNSTCVVGCVAVQHQMLAELEDCRHGCTSQGVPR
jgi:hypothetical protein